jgi:type IV protein arginine methyltransferase
MAAADSGSLDAVVALLEAGAPWNAQDREGYTAGEYGSRHKEVLALLLDFAVRAELILGAVVKRLGSISAAVGEESKQSSSEEAENSEKPAASSGGCGAVNEGYLKGGVRYEDGKLLDEESGAVMMSWETPLMQRHADFLCERVRQWLCAIFQSVHLLHFVKE